MGINFNQTIEGLLSNPLNMSRGASDPKSGAPRARLRRHLTRFGPFLALLVFVGSFTMLLRWLNDEGPQKLASTELVSPLQIENLQSFTVRKDGQKQWEISAQKVELSTKADQTIATNVSKATLFRNGKAFLILKAPLVKLANNTNNLEATGGISATGNDKFSFQTSVARWLNNKKLVQCPKAVRATLRGFEFDAPSLLYYWDSGQLICKEPVELRTKGAVLRSHTLKANVKSRELELGGGVELIFNPQTANFQQELGPSEAN